MITDFVYWTHTLAIWWWIPVAIAVAAFLVWASREM